MPGRYINDHQMRLYMKFRLTESMPAARRQPGKILSNSYPASWSQARFLEKAREAGSNRPHTC